LTIKERFTVSSKELASKVKQLLREGNIKRVRLIRNERTLLDIPISIGAPAAAVGIVAAPLLAAVATIAAMVTECTIEVERAENKKGSKNSSRE
jgi:DNA-binding Lrp family transcriptional regulator